MGNMRRILTSIVLVCIAASAQAADKTPCPHYRPGEPYPWVVNDLMSGDQWGDLSIDLDTKGKPTGCRAIKGNLESEMGFWVCRSMLAQGEFDPVMKDGVPVAGSRIEHFVLEGMRHRDANAAARKRWFAAHPSERQSCYPD
jgi:hypothetical protein